MRRHPPWSHRRCRVVPDLVLGGALDHIRKPSDTASASDPLRKSTLSIPGGCTASRGPHQPIKCEPTTVSLDYSNARRAAVPFQSESPRSYVDPKWSFQDLFALLPSHFCAPSFHHARRAGDQHEAPQLPCNTPALVQRHIPTLMGACPVRRAMPRSLSRLDRGTIRSVWCGQILR